MPAAAPPDLLIKGGRVIDPRNNIDAVLDVAVSGGKVARVAANIQPAAGMRVIDATGLYVVPGLIDIHAHVFFGTEKDAYLSNADSAVQPDAHSFRTTLHAGPDDVDEGEDASARPIDHLFLELQEIPPARPCLLYTSPSPRD